MNFKLWAILLFLVSGNAKADSNSPLESCMLFEVMTPSAQAEFLEREMKAKEELTGFLLCAKKQMPRARKIVLTKCKEGKSVKEAITRAIQFLHRTCKFAPLKDPLNGEEEEIYYGQDQTSNF